MSDNVQVSTHGQQLLLASKYSAAEVARLLDVGRQRVSDWRRGVTRPDDAYRRAMSSKLGIPESAWGEPAVPGDASMPPKPADVPPPVPDADRLAVMTDDEVDSMGLAGIQATARWLRRRRERLPPREAVQAAIAEGRLHDRYVTLLAKERTARQDYLEGQEFRDDVAVIRAAFPASACELRTRLGRFGVELPAPPSNRGRVEGAAPTIPADVEDLIGELQTAAAIAASGEPNLAAAHVLALGIDHHCDAIAGIVADDPGLAGRLLDLLPVDGPDHRAVRAALERRVAVRAALGLPAEARKVVAELLEVLGHTDISTEIGG